MLKGDNLHVPKSNLQILLKPVGYVQEVVHCRVLSIVAFEKSRLQEAPLHALKSP